MGKHRQGRRTQECLVLKRKGRWWRKDGSRVTCLLCPHQCSLPEGKLGLCGVRLGTADGIALPAWGMLTAAGLDPIEKKPLYHFYPGRKVWSVGFAGCNLDCPFCQNYRISNAPAGTGTAVSPEELARNAVEADAAMVAFTYSEPTVHAEYIIEAAKLVRSLGMSTVMVTNGHVNSEPAVEILKRMDGVNIDLKSWSGDYYRKILKGSLKAVREFIQIARKHSWVELTTLIVTGDNDGENETRGICEWIASLSPDIPFHLSAYHPAHRYSKAPTSKESLAHLAGIAKQYLPFVYIGNAGFENHTFCPGCQRPVIRRHGYRTDCGIVNGQCPTCSQIIPGVYG